MRSLVYSLDKRFEILRLPEYHLMTLADTESVLSMMDEADIVFAQRVAPDFPLADLRPPALRQRFGARCTLWPNIYFDGYFPGLRYIYGNDSRKLVGPLGDYHFEQVFLAWYRGADPATAAADLMSPVGWPWNPGDPCEASLEQLRLREGDCDVIISDHIARNFSHRKLMYAMNHPVNSVLLEMLDRLMAFCGIASRFRLDGVHQKERLGLIDIPALPRYFADRITAVPAGQGFETFAHPDATVAPMRHSIDPLALAEDFFRLYNDNRGVLQV